MATTVALPENGVSLGDAVESILDPQLTGEGSEEDNMKSRVKKTDTKLLETIRMAVEYLDMAQELLRTKRDKAAIAGCAFECRVVLREAAELDRKIKEVKKA